MANVANIDRNYGGIDKSINNFLNKKRMLVVCCN